MSADQLQPAPITDVPAPSVPECPIRVGAYAIVLDEADRLLLCRLAATDLDAGWTLPGGGLDFGEDPQDGALRELEEETGLRGKIVDLAGIDSRVYPPHQRRATDLHMLRILYHAEIVGGELRHELEGSTDRAEWFARAEIVDLPVVDLIEVALAMLDRRSL